MTTQYTIEFATQRYQNRRKSTNVPYIIHPLEVLKQLSIWGFNEESYPDVWQIAILHDILEDTKTTSTELEIHFNKEISEAVQILTYNPLIETKPNYIERIASAPPKLLIIKIADRICNVRDFIISDPTYAKKYFQKAIPLITALQTRKKELISLFGETIWLKINYTITNTIYSTQHGKTPNETI